MRVTSASLSALVGWPKSFIAQSVLLRGELGLDLLDVGSISPRRVLRRLVGR